MHVTSWLRGGWPSEDDRMSGLPLKVRTTRRVAACCCRLTVHDGWAERSNVVQGVRPGPARRSRHRSTDSASCRRTSASCPDRRVVVYVGEYTRRDPDNDIDDVRVNVSAIVASSRLPTTVQFSAQTWRLWSAILCLLDTAYAGMRNCSSTWWFTTSQIRDKLQL